MRRRVAWYSVMAGVALLTSIASMLGVLFLSKYELSLPVAAVISPLAVGPVAGLLFLYRVFRPAETIDRVFGFAMFGIIFFIGINTFVSVMLSHHA